MGVSKGEFQPWQDGQAEHYLRRCQGRLLRIVNFIIMGQSWGRVGNALTKRADMMRHDSVGCLAEL